MILNRSFIYIYRIEPPKPTLVGLPGATLSSMREKCRLVVLYTCEKFRENIMKRIRFVERTRVCVRNGYVQCSKGNNSKSRQTRVTIHVFCTLSNCALHWWEVL